MKTQDMTFFQLRELARDLGITDWSLLRKAVLRERVEGVLSQQSSVPIRAARAT